MALKVACGLGMALILLLIFFTPFGKANVAGLLIVFAAVAGIGLSALRREKQSG